MGARFANFVVLYAALYFGWDPPPASWGVISSTMLQFSSSFSPGKGDTMGPEGLVAYEYVDDGAFAEPWLGLRPWLSVSLWEYGLMKRLCQKSLRLGKKAVDGSFAAKIALWGLDICTVSRMAENDH